MKVCGAIARHLVDSGFDVMFGLIGHGNLFMVNEFRNAHGGTYIAAAHETGAVQMALGYAVATNGVGVATVTHGPGLTNTVTPLVEGARGRIPLVLIAGDTATEDDLSLQDIPQNEVVLPTGAGFQQVRAPGTVLADLRTAFRRARAELRPIVLNIPLEFQWQDVSYQPPTASSLGSQAIAPDPAALDDAAGIIAAARRPIVLAGRGAATSGAKPHLLRLAERLGAPVANTLKGKDFFRGDDFDLGLFGTLSSQVAAETILASDCVVAFGASLNRYTTADGAYVSGKRIVQCDIESGQVGKLCRVDAPVVGDASTVAAVLVEMMDEAGLEPSGFRSEALAKRLATSDEGIANDSGSGTTVDIRRALQAIDEAFPDDRLLVTDGGRFLHQAFARLRVPDSLSFVMTNNFGSIGFGMGHAIGAAASAPGRPTLLVTGDGGFMNGGLVELNTAVRHGLDLTVVVLNDGSYGSEHVQFTDRGLDPAISMFDWPEFAPVADALGGQGATVRNSDDLAALDELIRRRTRPLLIDVKLDPMQVPVDAS